MKGKKNTNSELTVNSRKFRGRKDKKVMSRCLAERIDDEAKSNDGAGLKQINEDVAKTYCTNFGELDLERALYRWHKNNHEEKNLELHSNVVISLTVEEFIKKAKSLALVLGGSSTLSESITKSWVLQWQKKYGVPELSSGTVDDTNVLVRVNNGEERLTVNGKEEKQCLEPIKQRLKKKSSKKENKDEFKKFDGFEIGPTSPNERKLKEFLTIETGEGDEKICLTDSVRPLLHLDINGIHYNEKGYGNDQVYFAFCFELDWTSIPGKTICVENEDPVWLLMAANRSGRHRTRILVTGRQWRPQCLKHVNMLSQPVVYAGGGKGMLTPDLFGWWFRKEFMPAAESFNSVSVLVADKKWLSPKLYESSDSRNVHFLSMSQSEIADWDLIFAEFKTRYVTFLLKSLVNSFETISLPEVTEYLKEFTLKDAFPLFHKAWLSIRSESFQRLSPHLLVRKKEKEAMSQSTISNEENGLINLTKERVKVKDEFKLEDLKFRVLKDDGKAENVETNKLVLTRKPGVMAVHEQEDKILLLELQWLVHDIGLEVSDDELLSWVLNFSSLQKEAVKAEQADSNKIDENNSIPAPSETVEHLKKTLLWMETQPIDSNLLIIVRDIMEIAKQASKMGLAHPHPGAALPFFCHNGDHLTQPPPAHMGIPPYQLDAKGAGAMGEYWRGLGLGGISIRPSASGPPGSPVPPHPAISPQDWKRLGPLLAASGLSRTPMYPFSAGSTYPYPMLSPEMSQVPASWHTPGMYPISAGAGFRSPYPTSLPISSTTLPSDFYRFSPTSLLPGHPGLSPHGHHSALSSHPAIVTPGPKQELGHHTQSDHNHRSSSLDHKNSSSSHHSRQDSKTQDSSSQNDKKKPHIKKPLNAFMLYMKEMRAKVVAECTLKESAAINQILGRRWHSLTRDEQAKYYEKARHERQLHMQLYPGWSARDNYGYGTKKKKRKKERTPEITSLGGRRPIRRGRALFSERWHALGREEQAKYYELARRERQLHMQLYPDWSSRANSSRGKKRKRKQEANDGGNNMKKCRARYGLDQQSQWCKPCRRKKKCIRYLESGEERDGNQSEDNLGSCGSVGEARTPPDDDDGAESLPHSLSSPGGLSGLSSLTSPSMILPSPSTSLASPSVSLASPCMSLQSPLTPPTFDMKPIMPIALPPLNRNPVGTNPHDVNNPLSVNQLTGKCIKSEPKEQSRPISVT